MAVKIRFKQTGKRNAHTFRVVAIDESKRRDGAVIEELGFVNTSSPKKPLIHLTHDRIKYWISQGAKPTDAVAKLLTPA
ncbi:MAG: 30S ribosomal protein S16 [Patescibacteria group bacterium]